GLARTRSPGPSRWRARRRSSKCWGPWWRRRAENGDGGSGSRTATERFSRSPGGTAHGGEWIGRSRHRGRRAEGCLANTCGGDAFAASSAMAQLPATGGRLNAEQATERQEREAVRSSEGQGHVEAARGADRQL